MSGNQDAQFAVPAWLASRHPGARILPVAAGWSDDRKYRVETVAETLLVRVSPLAAYARKQEEFLQLTRLNVITDALPRAVMHGSVPEHEVCFLVYEWVTGKEARESCPGLKPTEHYNLGLTAGRLLRRIHDLPQERRIDSHAAIRRKVDIRRRCMEEQGLGFPGYEAMVSYLERHMSLLVDAPTAFRHGDFHLGNMLIDPHGQLRVIDFNRSDFGDPLEDFGRLFTFSRQISTSFARGQIHGYFDGAPPPGFFAHVLCYVLIDCAFGLLWAMRYGESEISVHNGLVKQVMDDFDWLEASEPRWYAGE